MARKPKPNNTTKSVVRGMKQIVQVRFKKSKSIHKPQIRKRAKPGS